MVLPFAVNLFGDSDQNAASLNRFVCALIVSFSSRAICLLIASVSPTLLLIIHWLVQ